MTINEKLKNFRGHARNIFPPKYILWGTAAGIVVAIINNPEIFEYAHQQFEGQGINIGSYVQIYKEFLPKAEYELMTGPFWGQAVYGIKTVAIELLKS